MDRLNRRIERLEAALQQPSPEILSFPDQASYSEWLSGNIDQLFNPNVGEAKVYLHVDLELV